MSTGSRASFLLASQTSGRYLEARFGYTTRLLASLAFSLQMILYMGIVLYAPSLALSAVTGLNFTGSVIAVGLVCTFYSSLGGMKAVLMTDVFQSLLMFAAVFTVIGRVVPSSYSRLTCVLRLHLSRRWRPDAGAG